MSEPENSKKKDPIAGGGNPQSAIRNPQSSILSPQSSILKPLPDIARSGIRFYRKRGRGRRLCGR
jgi:hypothetical protein